MLDKAHLARKGRFYSVYDTQENFVLEDKTKRGLEVRETNVDEKYGVESDYGMIHDMNGIGHKVAIRWYFPKKRHSIDDVVEVANRIESRYKAIQEMTCPDDE